MDLKTMTRLAGAGRMSRRSFIQLGAAAGLTVTVADSLFTPEASRRRGWFVASPVVDGVRPGVPLVWGTVATLGAVGMIVQRGAVWAMREYTEGQLTAILIAGIAIGALALGIPLRRLFVVAAEVGQPADAQPARLYEDGDGAFEFERTASRLMEMQSDEYLALGHGER